MTESSPTGPDGETAGPARGEAAEPQTRAADIAVPPEAIKVSAGASYWSVSGCGWGDGPGLPEEYAALLAPPIAVRAAAVARPAPRPERVSAPRQPGRHRRT